MITPLLAQADIGQVQASFLKQMVIALFAFGALFGTLIIALFAWLQYRLDKKSKEREEKRSKETQPREITPQPLGVELASRKWTASVARQAHDSLKEIVDEHSEEIRQLREDHTELSTDIRDKLADMPGKIVVDILNAQKLGGKHD
jgi:uncharacterized membrane protein YciS (DUF1049 family)